MAKLTSGPIMEDWSMAESTGCVRTDFHGIFLPEVPIDKNGKLQKVARHGKLQNCSLKPKWQLGMASLFKLVPRNSPFGFREIGTWHLVPQIESQGKAIKMPDSSWAPGHFAHCSHSHVAHYVGIFPKWHKKSLCKNGEVSCHVGAKGNFKANFFFGSLTRLFQKWSCVYLLCHLTSGFESQSKSEQGAAWTWASIWQC